MAEQVLRFRVTFGDWSDDGHGKTSTTDVEIVSRGSRELTEERILKNYRANEKALGFGLQNLWEEYEQYHPHENQLVAVAQKLGAVYYSTSGGILYGHDGAEVEVLRLDGPQAGAELPANCFVLDDSYSDELYLPYEEHLRFAMFIILAGLKKTSWREIKQRNLFGSSQGLLLRSEHVGYGLFS